MEWLKSEFSDLKREICDMKREISDMKEIVMGIRDYLKEVGFVSADVVYVHESQDT